MDDAGLLDPELDLAALGRAYGLSHVGRNRAELRVGHEPARPQNAAELADNRHHVWSCYAAVEFDLAALDLGSKVLVADQVGTRFARGIGLVALRKDGDTNRLAGAMGQRHDAAHHLVRMARVDAEADAHFDGLVELRLGPLLHQRDRLAQRIRPVAVDLLLGLPQPFPVLRHRF